MEGHENPHDSQSVVLEPPITMPIPGHICRAGNSGNTIYQSPAPPAPRPPDPQFETTGVETVPRDKGAKPPAQSCGINDHVPEPEFRALQEENGDRCVPVGSAKDEMRESK